MQREIAYWLKGQIDAVRASVLAISETLSKHDKHASEAMRKAEYDCNRAWVLIDTAQRDGGDSKEPLLPGEQVNLKARAKRERKGGA